ncbi:MAG: hypothetical protein HQ559_06425 [Lentisphaerae bacterium]|nr:hypothetical protein [Lentisphaerota bacterium]
MKKAPRRAFDYVIIFLAGAAVLILVTPFVQSSAVRRNIDRAEEMLLRKDGTTEALSLLRRWEPRSTAFPLLNVALRVQKTVCLARLGRPDEAAEIAAGIRFGKRSPVPAGFMDLLQGPATGIVNARLVRRAREEDASPWLAYEMLVAEWATRGDGNRIQALARQLDGTKVSAHLEAAFARQLNPPAVPAARQVSVAPPAGSSPSAPVDRPTSPRPSAPAQVTVSSWGVVRAGRSGVYDRNGKLVAKARAGTILDIREKKKTKAGLLLVCRILDAKADSTRDYVLRARDVEIREGSYADASEQEKSLTIEAAELEAEIAVSARSASAAVSADNPHRGPYLAAKKEYDKFWDRVKELERQRDTTTGDNRVAALDELRSLKGEDVLLGRKFEAAKRPYDKWNQAQPRPGNPDNGEIKALRSRLAKVRKKLTAVGTGP